MNLTNSVLLFGESQQQFALTASLLNAEGYYVRFANDASNILNLAEAEAPDLIISELAVPNVDGLELCCRLRNARKLESTPILLVGDLSRQSSIVVDGLRCGAADYVQKPIDQVQLFRRCLGLIGSRAGQPVTMEGENLFDSLIANISDVITIISLDGTILFGSPSAKRILGYPGNTLLDTNFFDLIHPAEINKVTGYFNFVRNNTGPLLPVEHWFREQNGGWKAVTSIGRLIDDSRFGMALVITSSEADKPVSRRGVAFRPINEDILQLNISRWKVDNSLISEN